MADPHNVKRTVLISPQTDVRLRSLAHRQNRSTNDLIRDFLETGLAMQTAEPPVAACSQGSSPASEERKWWYIPGDRFFALFFTALGGGMGLILIFLRFWMDRHLLAPLFR